MKTKFFTLLAVALLLSSISFAKLFRVGYVGPLVASVDFTDPQAAHDAASNGDTLQFYPGTTGSASYNIYTYNKKLVLIGNGYFINDQSYVNNIGLNMITGNVSLTITPTVSSTGSDGTIMEGFSNASIYFGNISNVTITRCEYAYFYFPSDGNSLTNCKITQCYNASVALGATTIATNLRIENCVTTPSLAKADPSSTFLINNCYLQGVNFGDNNVVVQNCIITSSSSVSGVSNTVFNNNIFDAQPAISGANNKFNVNIQSSGANVFVGIPTQGTYSEDAKYQLTATSPAKGTGIGGVDLGPFGGANPYHLSGIAPIPAIYKLQAATPNATTNPYPVTVSVRSNN